MSSLFDRYALPLVPFLVVLVLPPAVRWVRISSALGLFCLILTAVFSVAATHDYMSWNRARKTAYDYLSEEAHIPPTFIDGGFEINGWLQAGPDRFANETDKSWWFVTEDDYVLAFDQLEGFEQWQAYPFPTLLPIGTDSLWILKKAYIREFDDDDFPISSDLESRSPNNENFRSSQPNIEFSNGQLQVEGKARSGKYALKLTAQDAFGLTTKFWDFNAGDRIMVSVWRYPAGSGAGIVIDSEYGNSFYLFDNKTVVVPAENGWEQLQAEMVIPSFPGKDRISIYIWNNTQEDVWLDDIRIDRTRPGD